MACEAALTAASTLGPEYTTIPVLSVTAYQGADVMPSN